MRLWRKTSTEMAGAWRSLRYDMGRRPFEPPADGPDVTSTGMNTFGGQLGDFGAESIEMPVAGRPPASSRPPRGAALVSAFGLLTVLGAAGAYLVVVNGLVPLRDETPAAAGAFTPPPATATATTADSGIGPSKPLSRPRATSPKPVGPGAGGLPATGGGAAPIPPAPRHASPVRTVKPTGRECRCDNPPVPTPTAPASAPSPTPSAPAPASSSPSVSPSDRDTSGFPGKSLEPRSRWKAWHHRHPH